MMMASSFAMPNGNHYSLNIIGVDNPKTADMTDTNRHTIFVDLYGASKIELIESLDGTFKVLDGNATGVEIGDPPYDEEGDTNVARFQLPKPGIDPYIIEEDPEPAAEDWHYTVWARPLGKPGTGATLTTCAELILSDEEGYLKDFLSKKDYQFIKTLNRDGLFGGIASVEQVGQKFNFREKGKSRFEDVTAIMTTIVLEVEVEYLNPSTGLTETDIIYVRVPIFHDFMEGYYWEYDNNGLKLMQVRFYPGKVELDEQ